MIKVPLENNVTSKSIEVLLENKLEDKLRLQQHRSITCKAK